MLVVGGLETDDRLRQERGVDHPFERERDPLGFNRLVHFDGRGRSYGDLEIEEKRPRFRLLCRHPAGRRIEGYLGRLRNAYRYLLEGNALDAEVEVEIAENLAQDAATWSIIHWIEGDGTGSRQPPAEQIERPWPWFRLILASRDRWLC